MNFIEIKINQINIIIKNNIKKKKSNFYKIFKIKINNNIIINNFTQINFLKKKKKIYFFPKIYYLNNITIKKNLFFLNTNIFII